MYNFKEKYQYYLNIFENYADKQKEIFNTKSELLTESLKYSLYVGGKRVRPVLALATAELLGVDFSEVLPFAFALECIHTYSLIHDDLPSMDNDDFRRGKPSNHKVYGEANAILAGDGLLNTAYSICFKACLKGETHCLAANLLCEFAGIYGMICGQSLDIAFSNQTEFTEDDLLRVYQLKTGKLLLAPILIPSILSGNKLYFELEELGKKLGLLFQITDDILDEIGSFEKLGKTIGKDKDENKLTSVRVYSLDGAKIRADMYATHCYHILDGLDGDVEFFRDLITYVRNREK